MKIYTFASENLTNIWAGIGAGMWAVSERQANNIPAVADKASRMLIGSLGIFWCSATQSFTTPFLVYSQPKEGVVEKEVWHGSWTLPFKIHALGTPRRQLHKDRAKELLPVLQNSEKSWNHVFHVEPVTVFVPTEITPEDWKILVDHLAD